MSWSIGYDANWKRDIGYGVPAFCDHPGCGAEIDRGLAHVCGGEPYGGRRGCGLYFCAQHLFLACRLPQLCDRCCAPKARKPFPPTPEHPVWVKHKLTDESWKQWRDENPDAVAALSKEMWWCNAHEREATAVDPSGRHCCDPKLAGLMCSCSCVNLTGIALIYKS